MVHRGQAGGAAAAIDKVDEIIYKKRDNFGKRRIGKRKDEVNMRKIYVRAAVLLTAKRCQRAGRPDQSGKPAVGTEPNR